MPSESPTTATRWISTAVARQRLGLSRNAIGKLVRRGAFVTRQLPGLRVQIDEASVERVEREFIRPAAAMA